MSLPNWGRYWLERVRPWLPLPRGLLTVDPLRPQTTWLEHPDLEVLAWEREMLRLQRPSLCLPEDRSPLFQPGVAQRAAVVLTGRPWSLRFANAQLLTGDRRILHDPTTDWSGIYRPTHPCWPLPRTRRSVLQLSNFGTVNYYHWLYNPTLAALRLTQELEMFSSETLVYLGPAYGRQLSGFVQESLDRLQIPPNRWRYQGVCPRRAIAAFETTEQIWPSLRQALWLRQLFPTSCSRPTRRLYIQRGNVQRRRILNESQVLAHLLPLGFEVVDPSHLSVQAQADLFASASWIVAAHGAALTNLTFAHPATRVLELVTEDYQSPLFYALADQLNLRYAHVIMPVQANPEQPDMGDMVVDLPKLARILGVCQQNPDKD